MKNDIDKLIAWARWYRDPKGPLPPATTGIAADIVISMLSDAPSLPCGHTVTGARDSDGPYVELDGDTMSPEDARVLAVAILRAADAADSARAADEGEG
jgi:hypothetical protein